MYFVIILCIFSGIIFGKPVQPGSSMDFCSVLCCFCQLSTAITGPSSTFYLWLPGYQNSNSKPVWGAGFMVTNFQKRHFLYLEPNFFVLIHGFPQSIISLTLQPSEGSSSSIILITKTLRQWREYPLPPWQLQSHCVALLLWPSSPYLLQAPGDFSHIFTRTALQRKEHWLYFPSSSRYLKWGQGFKVHQSTGWLKLEGLHPTDILYKNISKRWEGTLGNRCT